MKTRTIRRDSARWISLALALLATLLPAVAWGDIEVRPVPFRHYQLPYPFSQEINTQFVSDADARTYVFQNGERNGVSVCSVGRIDDQGATFAEVADESLGAKGVTCNGIIVDGAGGFFVRGFNGVAKEPIDGFTLYIDAALKTRWRIRDSEIVVFRTDGALSYLGKYRAPLGQMAYDPKSGVLIGGSIATLKGQASQYDTMISQLHAIQVGKGHIVKSGFRLGEERGEGIAEMVRLEEAQGVPFLVRYERGNIGSSTFYRTDGIYRVKPFTPLPPAATKQASLVMYGSHDRVIFVWGTRSETLSSGQKQSIEDELKAKGASGFEATQVTVTSPDGSLLKQFELPRFVRTVNWENIELVNPIVLLKEEGGWVLVGMAAGRRLMLRGFTEEGSDRGVGDLGRLPYKLAGDQVENILSDGAFLRMVVSRIGGREAHEYRLELKEVGMYDREKLPAYAQKQLDQAYESGCCSHAGAPRPGDLFLFGMFGLAAAIVRIRGAARRRSSAT